MARLTIARVQIANGASLSNELDCRQFTIRAIQMPASWTAANLTFQGRPFLDADRVGAANDALQDVYDSAGTELNVTAAAARYIVLTAAHQAALNGLGKIKVRSGTAGVGVNQGAARELLLVVEPRQD